MLALLLRSAHINLFKTLRVTKDLTRALDAGRRRRYQDLTFLLLLRKAINTQPDYTLNTPPLLRTCVILNNFLFVQILVLEVSKLLVLLILNLLRLLLG